MGLNSWIALLYLIEGVICCPSRILQKCGFHASAGLPDARSPGTLAHTGDAAATPHRHNASRLPPGKSFDSDVELETLWLHLCQQHLGTRQACLISALSMT